MDIIFRCGDAVIYGAGLHPGYDLAPGLAGAQARPFFESCRDFADQKPAFCFPLRDCRAVSAAGAFMLVEGFLDAFFLDFFEFFMGLALVKAEHALEKFEPDESHRHQASDPPPGHIGEKRTDFEVF